MTSTNTIGQKPRVDTVAHIRKVAARARIVARGPCPAARPFHHAAADGGMCAHACHHCLNSRVIIRSAAAAHAVLMGRGAKAQVRRCWREWWWRR